jgi:hypothetical protein
MKRPCVLSRLLYQKKMCSFKKVQKDFRKEMKAQTRSMTDKVFESNIDFLV